jgi:hypothetical protein
MKKNLLDTKPITPGTCEWCGKECELEDTACSLSCEAQMRRLEAVQGRTVLRVLKLWRKHSGRKGSPGEGAFSEVTAMVDRFLRTDRTRREEAGQKRRQKDAEDAANKVKTPKKGTGRTQTAAPLVDQPEGPSDATGGF